MGGGPSFEQKQAAASQANLANQQAATGNEMLGLWKQQFGKITPFATKTMNEGDPYMAKLATNGNAFYGEQAAGGNPFFAKMETSGLPYYNAMVDATGGDTSRSFAPAYGALNRRLSTYGSALPSGFATGARSDLNAARAATFDANLNNARGQQYAAKTTGAQTQQDIRSRAAAAQQDLMFNAALQDRAQRMAGAGLLTGQQAAASPTPYYSGASQGYGNIVNATTLTRQSPLATILGGALGGVSSAIPF